MILEQIRKTDDAPNARVGLVGSGGCFLPDRSLVIEHVNGPPRRTRSDDEKCPWPDMEPPQKEEAYFTRLVNVGP